MRSRTAQEEGCAREEPLRHAGNPKFADALVLRPRTKIMHGGTPRGPGGVQGIKAMTNKTIPSRH